MLQLQQSGTKIMKADKLGDRTMSNELILHPLFEGIHPAELGKLLECLSTFTKNYKKDEYIIQEGKAISYIGILMSGRVFMEKEDCSGNVYFFTEIPQEHLFGEVFICPRLLSSTVNYRAITDCTILFIRYDSILHLCGNNCKRHQQLITNLVNLLALKSRYLLEKIEIISKKTIRERILSYLEHLAEKEHSKQVVSPFNHKELADFLCVNRSAMIRELRQMKLAQLIDYNKNNYILKTGE